MSRAGIYVLGEKKGEFSGLGEGRFLLYLCFEDDREMIGNVEIIEIIRMDPSSTSSGTSIVHLPYKISWPRH